jgi:hypothetical protein
MCQYGWDEVWR